MAPTAAEIDHREWDRLTAGIAADVHSIARVLDAQMPYLRRVDASSTQTALMRSCQGFFADLSAQVDRYRTTINSKYKPLNEAVESAGGEVAGVKTYHAE